MATTIQRLDTDVEQRLIDEAKAGSGDAMMRLIEQYSPAIKAAARRSSVEPDDAEQECAITIMEIVTKTDDLTPRRLAALVRDGLWKHLGEYAVESTGVCLKARTVRTAERVVREHDGDVDAARRTISAGGEHMSVEVFDAVIAARLTPRDVMDVETDATRVSLEAAPERHAREFVSRIMDAAELNDTARRVISGVHGLGDDGRVWTAAELADELGLSVPTINRIRRRAIADMTDVANGGETKRRTHVRSAVAAPTTTADEQPRSEEAAQREDGETNANESSETNNSDAVTEPTESLAVRVGVDSRTAWAPTGVGCRYSLARRVICTGPGPRLASSARDDTARHDRDDLANRSDVAAGERDTQRPPQRSPGSTASVCTAPHIHAEPAPHLRPADDEMPQKPRCVTPREPSVWTRFRRHMRGRGVNPDDETVT